jgi:hypothetical protein
VLQRGFQLRERVAAHRAALLSRNGALLQLSNDVVGVLRIT